EHAQSGLDRAFTHEELVHLSERCIHIDCHVSDYTMLCSLTDTITCGIVLRCYPTLFSTALSADYQRSIQDQPDRFSPAPTPPHHSSPPASLRLAGPQGTARALPHRHKSAREKLRF